jgi:hypothetical protein
LRRAKWPVVARRCTSSRLGTAGADRTSWQFEKVHTGIFSCRTSIRLVFAARFAQIRLACSPNRTMTAKVLAWSSSTRQNPHHPPRGAAESFSSRVIRAGALCVRTIEAMSCARNVPRDLVHVRPRQRWYHEQYRWQRRDLTMQQWRPPESNDPAEVCSSLPTLRLRPF